VNSRFCYVSLYSFFREDYFRYDLHAFLASDANQHVIEHMSRLFTPSLVHRMATGLRMLLAQFPLHGPAEIIGPTIEGVGCAGD
jgi:hypothetical protein